MASKTNELMQIGLRLSNCRQNRNMTQEELAGRLGITPQAVSKWERGISLPDISMLADLAGILEVSTDWLLGICEQPPETKGTDSPGPDDAKRQRFQSEMGIRLSTLEPLELVFGMDIVPAFQADGSWLETARTLRKKLAEQEGIWMPIVRICDNLSLGKKEFMVLSFHKVLYYEELDTIDEGTAGYMLGKLEDTIRNKYHEILYPDLMKDLVDNLKIRYPALLEDLIPERISYGLLTETVKIVLSRGNSILYLPKMIEIMECALRRNPAADARELAEQILSGIQREDNFYVFLHNRRAADKAVDGKIGL